MRLFIALWPDEGCVTHLQSWARAAQERCGGRIMQAQDMHLTLAFLGEASPGQARQLAALAPGWDIPVRPFVLSRIDRFERARVVWAGPDEQDSSLGWLHLLYDTLWNRLATQGWQRRCERFRPHISLLRAAQAMPLEGLQPAPVVCRPLECRLVGSRPHGQGSRYTVLARLALRFESGTL